MEIEIELTREPIAEKIHPPKAGRHGAWLEFRGVVRDEENGQKIWALEYEAYAEMAVREIRRLLISSRHPCFATKIIHRVGIIPVGEAAIYAGVASAHRAEAIALLAEFMDRLKQDVPIWKRRGLPLLTRDGDVSSIHPKSKEVPIASPPHEPQESSQAARGNPPSPQPSPPGEGESLAGNWKCRVMELGSWFLSRSESEQETFHEPQGEKSGWRQKARPLPQERGNCRPLVRAGTMEFGSGVQCANLSGNFSPGGGGGRLSSRPLDEALAEISFRCRALPPIKAALEESFGRILRETVCAPADLPDSDRSTRDGYAILENDSSGFFQVVDTLHAADCKPRQLKTGEAARIATGASLPCENLRVVTQENVERDGDNIRILQADTDSNVRKRGEEVKAGAPLVEAGAYLDAGKLALMASAGCVRPLVSPRMRVIHFTTGDEVIPPDQTPKPGQIRDSNSILIRSLLQKLPCDLFQRHLPEDFEAAKADCQKLKTEIENAAVVLISGGASVGDKDFTLPLLKTLGFEIAFSQVSIRPGRPLIFGVNDKRVAFGLPGNPLSHFVCFHLFVAAALATLTGGKAKSFLRGRLAAGLDDALNSRETLWPARLEFASGQARLHPLNWSSSGDLTCLTQANALVRVPPNSHGMDAGAEVDFLPAGND